MSTIQRSQPSDLYSLLGSARSGVVICTPFYRDPVMGAAMNAIAADVEITLIVKLNVLDWCRGASDPVALLHHVTQRGIDRIWVVSNLHAKVFVADEDRALVGSANLTTGGFAGNMEACMLADASETPAIVRHIESVVIPSASPWTQEQLRQWVTTHKPSVDNERTTRTRQDADRKRRLHAVSVDDRDLVAFMAWVATQTGDRDAEMLIQDWANEDRRQNHTGHIKRSFTACAEFLAHLPHDLVIDLINYTELPEEVVSAWITYLSGRIGQPNDDAFVKCRNTLPTRLGGLVEGGGGSMPTFRRVLRMYACYRSQDDAPAE